MLRIPQLGQYTHTHTHFFSMAKKHLCWWTMEHFWETCMWQRRRENTGYYGYTTTVQHVIDNNAVDEGLTRPYWTKAAVRCFRFEFLRWQKGDECDLTPPFAQILILCRECFLLSLMIPTHLLPPSKLSTTLSSRICSMNKQSERFCNML